MVGIKGNLLNAPMSNSASSNFFKLLDKSEIECTEIAKSFIEQAKNQGDNFNKRLADDLKISTYSSQLDFLNKNQLVYGIK